MLQRAGASGAAMPPGMLQRAGRAVPRGMLLQRAGAAAAGMPRGMMQRAGAGTGAMMQRAGAGTGAMMQRAGAASGGMMERAGAASGGMMQRGGAVRGAMPGAMMQRGGGGGRGVAGARMPAEMRGSGGFHGRGVPRSPVQRTGSKSSILSAHALMIFFQNLRRFVSPAVHEMLVKRYSKAQIMKTTESDRRQIVKDIVLVIGKQTYIKAITFSKKSSKETSKVIMANLRKFATATQRNAISEKLKKYIAAGNTAPEDVLQRILLLISQTDKVLLKKCTEALKASSKKRAPVAPRPPAPTGLKPLPVAATSQPVYPNSAQRKASTSSASKVAKAQAKKKAAAALKAAKPKPKGTPKKPKGKKAASPSPATGKKRAPYKKRKKSDASSTGPSPKKTKLSRTKQLELEAAIKRKRKQEKRLAKQREEARKREEKKRLRQLRKEEKLQAQKKKRKLALAKQRAEALQLSQRYAADAKGKVLSPPRHAPGDASSELKRKLSEAFHVFEGLFEMPPVKRFGSGINLDAPTNALLSGNVVLGKFDETVIGYNKQFLSSADAGSKMLKLVSTQQTRGIMVRYLLSCLEAVIKETATNLVGLYLHRKLGEKNRSKLTYADSIHPRLDGQARIQALKDNLYTASEKVKLLGEAKAEKAAGSFKKMSEIHDAVLRQRQKLKRELLKKEKEKPGEVRAGVMREMAEAVKQFKEDSAKAQNAWKMGQRVVDPVDAKPVISVHDLLTHFQQGNNLSKTLWSMF